MPGSLQKVKNEKTSVRQLVQSLLTQLKQYFYISFDKNTLCMSSVTYNSFKHVIFTSTGTVFDLLCEKPEQEQVSH